LEFKGVGRKVGDCVRLYSLDCDSVVPVDTHVFQIYMNKYHKGSKKKVDSSNYGDVQSLFYEKFGKYAGWAHSFLFTAELPQFKETITPSKSKSKSKSKAKAEIEIETPSIKKKLSKMKSN
jgi:N-glycosylase/DNA lyase